MKERPHYLTIDYRSLGTISLAEFRQALLTDLAALQDELHVEFMTAPRLVIPITNEYGDPVRFNDLTNRSLTRIDTHHYRPACKDYDL
ncbi:MAG: hypothetical protein IT557_17370 [Alphaproteobacteria bacterium]|nr:hypothetical protein [Alphaproteobacteria bacterium]